MRIRKRDRARERLYGRVRNGEDGCIATFVYPSGEKTLLADSRKDAFERARHRWGDGWIGEPCFSNPWTIYLDLTGETRKKHAKTMRSTPSVEKQRLSRRYREGR